MENAIDRDDIKKQGMWECQTGVDSENIEAQHMMQNLQRSDERSKRIVLFNDLPGYGKVALAAMVPLFSRMGHFRTRCRRQWFPTPWILESSGFRI